MAALQVPVWQELVGVHCDELVHPTVHTPVLQSPAAPFDPVQAMPSAAGV